jgi:hypothetical protein
MITGAGNLEAIRARILALAGVSQTLVYENDTDDYRDEDGNPTVKPIGMPPHSIEVLVDAPDTTEQNALVANELWLCKPAGIQTYGSTPVTIQDSQHMNHTLYISHPYLRNTWFHITITTNALFPANGADLIKDAVVTKGALLNIGDDLIYQEFFAQVYSVPGVLTAEIKVMLPKVSYLLPGSPHLATLSALVTALRTAPLGNVLFGNGDYFATLGTNDVSAGNPNNLTSIKGSALAINDVFQVTNIVTPTIVFTGNLDSGSAAYIQPPSGYFAVAGNERAVFDKVRIKGV